MRYYKVPEQVKETRGITIICVVIYITHKIFVQIFLTSLENGILICRLHYLIVLRSLNQYIL